MADKRKYINRSPIAVKVGDVEIQPGATVELTESLWVSADEEPQLYRELTEDAGRIELVK